MAVKPASKKLGSRPTPLGDIIREEAAEAEREAMGGDMAFDPERDLGVHGPRAFQASARDKDQMVIDELLAGLPKNQGYYLKLYKEIMPNKFELKERIDNYDTWTDMEYEIMERVKAMTRKFGSQKWGSALYRVVVWRQGGIRETNKYPITDIIVDAGDNADAAANTHQGRVDPAEAANEQMHALGNMLKAVETIMPRAVDPNLQFQAVVQAFTAGKSEQSNGANQMTTMMMTMMTTMMTSMMELMKSTRTGPSAPEPAFEERMGKMVEMMKTFGLGQAPQPKGLAESLAEMKLLGFDPFKREDTIEQIAKLKALTGSLMDVMPNGGQAPERPGIFEKLVDSIAPHIPKIFSDIRAIADNAALGQKLQAIRQQQQPPPQTPMEARPTTRAGTPIGPQPNRMGAGDAFAAEPDMDPYSGFTNRPFPKPTEEGGGIEMFGSVEGGSAAARRAHANGQPIPQQPVASQPAQPPQQDAVPQRVQTLESGAIVPADMPLVLQQLHGLIENNLTGAYSALYETLISFAETASMIDGIQKGLLDGNVLTDELRKTGYPQLTHPPFLERARPYLNGFAVWVLENTMNKVQAICQKCVGVHIFENAHEFEKSEKTCGAETGIGQVCDGQLVLRSTLNATPQLVMF